MISNSGSLRWSSLKGVAALLLAPLGLAAGSAKPAPAQSRIKVLLVTGQSNRYQNWEVSSPIVARQLEDSGRFTVTVATTPAKGAAPNQDMSSFAPTFSDYQAVVLDYEGFEFAPPVKQAFVDYVKHGGGLVVLHAADNAFPGWAEYNEMIGVGGWGGATPGYASRTQAAGPKIRWRAGGLVLDHDTPGNAQHPSPHDFLMTVRAPEHPIMKGLPPAWMHANDELYSNLRGPARNVTILATATAPTSMPNGTGENEAIVMAIAFGQGRIFQDTLGQRRGDAERTDRADELGGLHRAPPTRHRMGRDRRGDDPGAARLPDRRQDVDQVSVAAMTS